MALLEVEIGARFLVPYGYTAAMLVVSVPPIPTCPLPKIHPKRAVRVGV